MSIVVLGGFSIINTPRLAIALFPVLKRIKGAFFFLWAGAIAISMQPPERNQFSKVICRLLTGSLKLRVS